MDTQWNQILNLSGYHSSTQIHSVVNSYEHYGQRLESFSVEFHNLLGQEVNHDHCSLASRINRITQEEKEKS